MISTVPDELLKKTSNAQLARLVRSLNERAVIITHATRVADIDAHLAAGADDVFLASVQTADAVTPAVRATLRGELRVYLSERQPPTGAFAGVATCSTEPDDQRASTMRPSVMNEMPAAPSRPCITASTK